MSQEAPAEMVAVRETAETVVAKAAGRKVGAAGSMQGS